MAINWEQLHADAGGRWLGNPIAYYWLAPIWLVLSVLLTPNLTRFSDYLLAVIVNVFALGLCALSFWLLLIGPFRQRRTRPIALGWVMAAGAGIGLLKGVVTTSVYWLLNPDFNLMQALPGKVFSVPFFGMWILPAVTIAYAAIARYREERAALVAEIVRREMEARRDAGSHEALADFDEVIAFVATARTTLASPASAKADQLPEVLTNLVENTLRPLSHTMWTRIDSSIANFSFRDLTRVMFRDHQFPTLATALVYSVIMAAPQIFATGLAQGIARVLFQVAVIVLVMEVTKRIPLRSEISGWTVFVVMNLTMTSAMYFGSQALFGDFPGIPGVIVFLMIVNVIGLTTLILGIGQSALRSRNAIRNQLAEFAHEEANDAVRSARNQLERRELAHYLHSHVQNRMLSAALRIQGAGRAGANTLVQEELTSIDAVFDDLLNHRWNMTDASLESELDQIRKNWNGLISLTLDSHALTGLSLSAATQEDLTNAVNEAITNAVRHGRAQHVDVSLAVASGLITLTCTDDGEGPTEGSPGLGSTLFDSISQGVWELRAQAPHGSKLVMSIAPDGAPRT